MIRKIIILLLIFLLYVVSSFNLKRLPIPESALIKINKYLFPHSFINKLEYELNKSMTPGKYFLVEDFKIKSDLKNLHYYKIENEKKLNYQNLFLNKFVAEDKLLRPINNTKSGSAYLDLYDDKLFIISAIGIIGYGEIKESSIIFKQIKNNINDFINFDQLNQSLTFSIKDLVLHNDRIFVSYTKELRDNCWTTNFLYANLNYEELKFKEFFISDQCVNAKSNKDNEFHAHQSGGRIVIYDDDNIIVSIGDYRNRYLAQDKESIFGKILKINISNGEFEILSMGHRNPQGLYFDYENKYILSTEHGPDGGDEINLINFNNDITPNYGWPIASYGEHYNGGKIPQNEMKYKKYPLLKSHSENGFIEPLKFFTPSIGISEIIKIKDQNKYAVASLRDKSLYFFELENKKIIDIQRVEIGERIRDIITYKNIILMYLENTGAIGLIKFEPS